MVRKKRVTYSCDQCRRRKIRCDWNEPCKSCQISNLKCIYSSRVGSKEKPPYGPVYTSLDVMTPATSTSKDERYNFVFLPPQRPASAIESQWDPCLNNKLMLPYINDVFVRTGQLFLFENFVDASARYRKKEEQYLKEVIAYSQNDYALDVVTVKTCFEHWFEKFNLKSDLYCVILDKGDLLNMTPLAHDLFAAGIVLMAINDGTMPYSNIFGIAFGQAFRVATLCAISEGSADEFRALVLMVITASLFGVTPLMKYLSTIAQSYGIAMGLHRGATYQNFDPILAKRLSTVWWTLCQFNTSIFLVTGSPPHLSMDFITAPSPEWSFSSGFSVLGYSAELGRFYEKVYKFFSGPNTENPALNLALVTTLNSELDRWFEGLPLELQKLAPEELTDFRIAHMHIIFCALKGLLWFHLAFSGNNEYAAEMCAVSARRTIELTQVHTRSSRKYEALDSLFVDLAYEVLFTILGKYPMREGARSDLILIEKSIPCFSKFILPSSAEQISKAWYILTEGLNTIIP